MRLIPYGPSVLGVDQVAVHGDAVRCPTPYILIRESGRRPLRLNGPQYVFPEPPDLRTMINAAAQLDYHCDHLKGFCDLWNKPPKLFLDRYFEFIAAMTEQQKVPLSQKLEKYGTLFTYRDWGLLAPRPLPRGGSCGVRRVTIRLLRVLPITFGRIV